MGKFQLPQVGSFALPLTPRGRYYVYGRHNGAINDMTWFVTVAVGGTTTLDLTGSNASGWPF